MDEPSDTSIELTGHKKPTRVVLLVINTIGFSVRKFGIFSIKLIFSRFFLLQSSSFSSS